MLPGKYPLTIYRGDSFLWQFVLWTDDTRTTPLDLTGASILSQIRNRPGGTLIVTLNCSVLLPNNIFMAIAAPQCATLPGTGVWDLQVTFPSGDVSTVLAGTVTSTPDVSALP
jgi:hypothetical protein